MISTVFKKIECIEEQLGIFINNHPIKLKAKSSPRVKEIVVMKIKTNEESARTTQARRESEGEKLVIKKKKKKKKKMMTKLRKKKNKKHTEVSSSCTCNCGIFWG